VAVLLAVALASCATIPSPVPALPEAPPGRLAAHVIDGAELVCMPPPLADWLWGAEERAREYRRRLVEHQCVTSWPALGLGFAAGAAAGAGACAAVRK
jgi:hypothetical protein